MLEKYLLKKLQEINEYTSNPILQCMYEGDCRLLDKYKQDLFISEKIENVMRLIEKTDLDFDEKFKSAFNEFSEGVAYLHILEKGQKIDRVPEQKNSNTPDFSVEVEGEEKIFIEHKSMSYLDGNNNYKEALESALASRASIEEQISSGMNFASAISIVQPFYKPNKKYELGSIKFIIESYIEKISQNIKIGQFSLGDTILMVNIQQTGLIGEGIYNCVPYYLNQSKDSIVSGILWNVVFGKHGFPILKNIEFSGAANCEGELKKDGIFHEFDFVKAVCFIYYAGSKDRKVYSFIRCEEDAVHIFLKKISDFINDSYNTNGYANLGPINK